MTPTSSLTVRPSPLVQPKWFIVRPSGKLVPLIATDQLPLGVHLVGAPRELSVSDLARMECLGQCPESEGNFTLEPGCKTTPDNSDHGIDQTQPIEDDNIGGSPAKQDHRIPSLELDNNPFTHGAPEYDVPPGGRQVEPTSEKPNVSMETTPQSDVRNQNAKENIERVTQAALSEMPWRQNPEHSVSTAPTPRQSILDTILDSDPRAAERVGYVRRPLPPSGQEPDPAKKTHCTYWIRTGECDYTQQGCMYKHEMPDVNKLKDLGFRETPKWWREQMGETPHSRRLPVIKRPGIDATTPRFGEGTNGQVRHESFQLPMTSIRRRILEETERVERASAEQDAPASPTEMTYPSRSKHTQVASNCSDDEALPVLSPTFSSGDEIELLTRTNDYTESPTSHFTAPRPAPPRPISVNQGQKSYTLSSSKHAVPAPEDDLDERRKFVPPPSSKMLRSRGGISGQRGGLPGLGVSSSLVRFQQN